MKKSFTSIEYKLLLELVELKPQLKGEEQKKLRKKIRNELGFRWQALTGSKKGFDTQGVKNLVADRVIVIDGNIEVNKKTVKVISKISLDKEPTTNDVLLQSKIFQKMNFTSYGKLNEEILSSRGFYVIKLRCESILPISYQDELIERANSILYIGKAEGQSLRKRLEQEILHKGAGTFFRSIGAVLGKRPPFESLKEKKNKKNYRFNERDNQFIIGWLLQNVEIAIEKFEGDFNKEESKMIKKYAPLLNYTHNPLKSKQLERDRELCREIARGVKRN